MKNLQEFDTLEEAQAPVIESKMLAPDIIVSLLTKYDSVLSLQEMAKANDKAAGFLLALSGSVQEFNLMNSHQIGIEQQQLLAYLVSINAVTQGFATALIAIANPEKVCFADVTQEQFLACKDAYSGLTTKTLGWDGQQYLRVTLHDDLYEPKNTTLFFTNAIFTNENLGVPRRLDKAGVYIFDLSKVRKGAGCKLHVNFNINANVSCELV